jgi:type I restriction enzyme R subunit
VDSYDADSTFLDEFYPPGHFSHIIIDECHRSAWGKWSEVLKRNPEAVQIGLTATPRSLEIDPGASAEAAQDAQITADNLKYFGEPVYSYDIAQGMEDGYLAACEIVKRDILLAWKTAPERDTGLQSEDLRGTTMTDAKTGRLILHEEADDDYDASSFERSIVLPDRVDAITRDLFGYLLGTGGPEQKSVAFCASDDHADRVAAALNNLYSAWARQAGQRPVDPFAFKCTAKAGGRDMLPDLKGTERSHFIACTVDLLSTGVDVEWLRNVVFFRYIRSPILFYQMIGRGTRIHEASGKLMFRVSDYTNATRLLGESFVSNSPAVKEPSQPDDGQTDGDDLGGDDDSEGAHRPGIIEVRGL